MVSGDSAAEQCILYMGADGHSLIDIVNAWAPQEDAPYWNRKGHYVAGLVQAALSLLARDLIEVWEEPAPRGEGSLMTMDRAAEALADPDNWWRYDPDENWDPGEDLSRYAHLAQGNTEPMATLYSVITTPQGLKDTVAVTWDRAKPVS